MMVFLQFSCSSDVVLRGGKHSIYLCHQLKASCHFPVGDFVSERICTKIGE